MCGVKTNDTKRKIAHVMNKSINGSFMLFKKLGLLSQNGLHLPAHVSIE